jgi:hypothetical protein
MWRCDNWFIRNSSFTCFMQSIEQGSNESAASGLLIPVVYLRVNFASQDLSCALNTYTTYRCNHSGPVKQPFKSLPVPHISLPDFWTQLESGLGWVVSGVSLVFRYRCLRKQTRGMPYSDTQSIFSDANIACTLVLTPKHRPPTPSSSASTAIYRLGITQQVFPWLTRTLGARLARSFRTSCPAEK